MENYQVLLFGKVNPPGARTMSPHDSVRRFGTQNTCHRPVNSPPTQHCQECVVNVVVLFSTVLPKLFSFYQRRTERSLC